MEIINYAQMDIAKRTVPFVIDSVQGEINSRSIKLSLFENGVAWIPGDQTEIKCSLAFAKADGTSGWYDTLPDGSPAYRIDENTISMEIAPQVLTVPGKVNAVIRLERFETNRATTFPFVINVAEDPAIEAVKSENYYNVQSWDEVNEKFSELQDVISSLTNEIVSELDKRPGYKGVTNSETFDRLTANIFEQGFYIVRKDDYDDLPETGLAETGFALFIFRYTTNYNIHLAYSINFDSVQYRIVDIRDGEIFKDWSEPNADKLLQMGKILDATEYDGLLSKAVENGVYGVSKNDWTDVPFADPSVLIVFRYTTNYVLQIGVNVKTGAIATRIVNINDNTVYRDWIAIGEETKKILVVGDSIARGYRNDGKGFVGDLGHPYLNAAVSGATISNKNTQYTNIPDQLEGVKDYDPDVIIAEGGINDYMQNAALGEIPTVAVKTEEETGHLDRNTVLGAIQYLFYTMVHKYPRAQRYFLLVHKVTRANGTDYTNTKNVAGYTQTELFDAIRKVCDLYNVQIIDVFNKSVIDMAFPEYRSPVSYEDDNTVTDREFVDVDGVHPLAYGYLHGYVPIVKQALQGGGDVGSAVGGGKDGYTPVKGKDYYTEADKAEMVNDVIAALPKYNGEVEAV